MLKIVPLFYPYFTKPIRLNLSLFCFLLLLIVIIGTPSCSFRYYSVKANLKDELKHVKIPTLLIWGDNDIVSNPNVIMREMIENLSNVPTLDTIIIEKSGHTPIFYENNQLVINKIIQFIQSPNLKKK